MLVDLHMHSQFSDGVYSVEELLGQAVSAGIGTIAITDHDIVGGSKKALQLVKELALPIRVIAGVELNTNHANSEVHILGYHLDYEQPFIEERLSVSRDNRLIRLKQMIDNLNNCGYPTTYEEVREYAHGARSFGRPHIAKLLIQKGFFNNQKDVFDELLYLGGPVYVEHKKISPLEAVDIIKRAGGVSVLAHPGLVHNDSIVEEIIENTGVQGIEVYYPTHTPQQIQKYRSMAKHYNLIISAGSDFHGTSSRYPSKLGVFTSISSNVKEILQWK